MKLAVTTGINMEEPYKKKEMVARVEDAFDYKSLSITDEQAEVMLFIK